MAHPGGLKRPPCRRVRLPGRPSRAQGAMARTRKEDICALVTGRSGQ